MKYLEIKDNKVYYCLNGVTNTIDKITVEDIVQLLELSLESEFDYDVYDAEKINNMVHNIIYKELYTKLSDFRKDSETIKNDIESIYKEAYLKYCDNIKI